MTRAAERASPHGELARHDDVPGKVTESRSAPTVARAADELAARRELRAWRLAAEHLNAAGYAAAVPAELVRPLTRRGLVVWPGAVRGVA